eukprot:m.20567 g.20567  ORF g.20567 m.20567 type:complete len:60 (+) comp6199_c1_seq1:2333-2512(+)
MSSKTVSGSRLEICGFLVAMVAVVVVGGGAGDAMQAFALRATHAGSPQPTTVHASDGGL